MQIYSAYSVPVTETRMQAVFIAAIALLHLAFFMSLLGKRPHDTAPRLTYVTALRLLPVPAMPRPVAAIAPAEVKPLPVRARPSAPSRPDAVRDDALEVAAAPPSSAMPADFSAAPAQTLDVGNLRTLARNNEKTRAKSDRERIRDGEQVDRTLETHIATAAKKAVRPDCEKAFAGGGLLALIPLAASLVTDVGCKWR